MADENNTNETISESTVTTTTTTTTTETIYPVTHAEAVLAGEAEPITHFEKVIAKYCTGGGSGTGDVDIVTTLDSTSTDTQIPSAKAVYDNLQSLIVSLTQAEYDALTDAQKNNGTIYLITQ